MDSQSKKSRDSSPRLDFYASDAIAPLVRELDVIDFSRGPPDLLTSVFNEFPRFINVRQLFFARVNFTLLHLQQISTLPSLRLLFLIDCEHPPHTDSLPLLHIHDFICIHQPHRIQTWRQWIDFKGIHHWFELLDPNHLRFLDVPLTLGLCSFFLAIDNPDSFPSLRTIKLFANLGLLSQVPMILSKTPALRSLKLFLHRGQHPTQYMDGFMSTTSNSVPYLEEYCGPHELLRAIRGRVTEPPSTHLRKLYLDSVVEGADSLDAYMDTLTLWHPHLKDLTHLHITMLESMDFKSLAGLEDMCPVLQELQIHDSKYCRYSGM
jgi:hypothetical protein